MTAGATPRRVLLLPGGPDFHQPEAVAQRLVELLRAAPGDELAFETEPGLDVLADADRLRGFDLVVSVWTSGRLTQAQEEGLLAAVRSGTAVGAVHGAATAFRDSPGYQAVVGGQFVVHPGGEDVTYRVTVDPGHPLAAGLDPFELTTEQYYLHVDPANRVLASTAFDDPDEPLTAGGAVAMPVAWTRSYGAGRVFYCALGHRPEVFDVPGAAALTARGLRWAADALPGR